MDNTFTKTCHKSYDRHKYKLFFKDGKTETYEWYDEVTARWFQTPRELLRHIEVIDRKKSK